MSQTAPHRHEANFEGSPASLDEHLFAELFEIFALKSVPVTHKVRSKETIVSHKLKAALLKDMAGYYTELSRLHAGEIKRYIEDLHLVAKNAEQQTGAAKRVAVQLRDLPSQVREFIEKRAHGGFRLPDPVEFENPDTRASAARDLIAILRMGAHWALGRNRPSGKRSQKLDYNLWTLAPDKVGRKRELAQEWFVTCLSCTWVETTGKEPPLFVTLSHKDTNFLRFVERCFSAVGIKNARNAAARAINRVGRDRRDALKKAKPLSWEAQTNCQSISTDQPA